MARALEGLRVLVVEDDPIIGLDLRYTLEEAGALVYGPAYNVPGALALLSQFSVDVGVLDNLIVDGAWHFCFIQAIGASCENVIPRFQLLISHRGLANWSERYTN